MTCNSSYTSCRGATLSSSEHAFLTLENMNQFVEVLPAVTYVEYHSHLLSYVPYFNKYYELLEGEIADFVKLEGVIRKVRRCQVGEQFLNCSSKNGTMRELWALLQEPPE